MKSAPSDVIETELASNWPYHLLIYDSKNYKDMKLLKCTETQILISITG